MNPLKRSLVFPSITVVLLACSIAAAQETLLKSIEGALGLPCLNHACDSTVNVMSDLFANLP